MTIIKGLNVEINGLDSIKVIKYPNRMTEIHKDVINFSQIYDVLYSWKFFDGTNLNFEDSVTLSKIKILKNIKSLI